LKGRAPPPVEKHLAKTADPVVLMEDSKGDVSIQMSSKEEATTPVFNEEIDSTDPIIITVNEVLNNEVLNNEVLDNEVLDNEVLDNEVLDNEVLDNEVLDNEDADYLGLSGSDDILEVNLDVNEIDAADTFQLKDKKEVYYEMYREALQKAKAAKAVALTEFMEARRIKNLYMLKDLNDSDDESDLEDLDDISDDE
jgi:hypothetical protein